MNGPSKIQQELIEEIAALKQRSRELEESEVIRRQAEEARQESERRFHSLVEATSGWIWDTE